MKKLILSVFLLLCLFGCMKKDDNKVNLMINSFPGAEHAFIYRAIDRGYFKDNGIEIQVIPSRGSKQVAGALHTESVNFGLISGDYLIISRHNGVSIKGIMTLYHDTPNSIFSFKEKNITKPVQLIGKKLGVWLKSPAYRQYHAMLKKIGIDKNAIQEIPAVRGGIKQLVDGEIDALMHSTHYAPVKLKFQGYEINEILMKENGIKIYGATLAATDKVIADNPGLVQKVTEILIKSLNESKNDIDGTLNALLNHVPRLNREQAKYSLERTNQLIFTPETVEHGIGYMNKKDWEITQKTLIDCGNIDNDIDVGLIYDDSFLKSITLSQ